VATGSDRRVLFRDAQTHLEDCFDTIRGEWDLDDCDGVKAAT
jgi:hypothetical protein